MSDHVFRCTGPCEHGTCSLGPDCRCRQFDGLLVEKAIFSNTQHDGCGCIIEKEAKMDDTPRTLDDAREEQQSIRLEELCARARASWEKYQEGSIPSPSVEVMVTDGVEYEIALAQAKVRWPGVAFHVRVMSALRTMASEKSDTDLLEEIRRHIERFPVAVNSRMDSRLMEITMGARGWESWILELRRLAGVRT